jgi:signal transduction histidine kinase
VSLRKRQSLFAKIFASIMAIVIAILITQALFVTTMFAFQTKQFKKQVFSSFKQNLEQTFSISDETGAIWDLASIGPALLMASDDRIVAFIIKDSQGKVLTTIEQHPQREMLIEQLPFPSSKALKGSVAGTIALYSNTNEQELVGFIDVIVYSPLSYYLTAFLLWRIVISLAITIPLALIIALIGSRIVASSVARNASNISVTLQSVANGTYLKEKETSLLANQLPTKKKSGPPFVELEQISIAVDELANQLNAHEQLRQQWLRSIAHDLNTPIAALKINIEGALDKVLPLDDKTLTQMRDELEVLQKRVESVLTLSILEAPDFKLNNQSFDTLDFVDEVLSSSFIDAEIDLDITKDKLDGERRLLVLALRELLKNSEKYKEVDSKISLKISGEDFNIIEVANAAIVDIEKIEKAFEMFYRFDESRSLSGSGLGLSIVKQIIQAHQGQAEIISDGQTVTVKLTWPSL